MNLPDFINKYLGKGSVGNTPENTGQCVGLVMKWLKDTLGNPHVWGHAKDLLQNADRSAYEVIMNTPDGVPQAGDVICWNGRMGGGFGHTAIIVKANVNTFEVLEQNNPTGANVRLHTYPNYNFIQGWLRPKNFGEDLVEKYRAEADQNRKDRDHNYNLYIAMRDENEKLKKTITELEGAVRRLEEENTGLKREIHETAKATAVLADQLKKKNEEDATAIDAGLDAQNELKEARADLEAVAHALETDPKLGEMLSRIDELRRPDEKVVKEHERLGEALFNLAKRFARKPGEKSFIQKLLDRLFKREG